MNSRKDNEVLSGRIVLVGTYKSNQLTKWPGWYCWPLSKGDVAEINGTCGETRDNNSVDASRALPKDGASIPEGALSRVTELWLFLGTKAQKTYKAEFVGIKTRPELVSEYGYPATGKAHGTHYALFKTKQLYRHASTASEEADAVIVRTKDFVRSPFVRKQLKVFLESPERSDTKLAKFLPSIVTKIPPERLCVCEEAVQMALFSWWAPQGQSILSDTFQRGVTSAEVLRRLKITRQNLEKCVRNGWLTKKQDDTSLFDEASLLSFQESPEYDSMLNGTVDNRNTLNDLTGKEWVPGTKSYMFQKGLGASHPHAQIEIQHPAPFSFQDIQFLVEFFTKKGMSVLDPFGGVGSTAKACELLKRKCTSIELSEKYHNLSIQRLETEVGEGTSKHHVFLHGDSCELLPKFPRGVFDFVVTSPPYWGILHKQDQKVLRNRVDNHLDTQYSDDNRDLGNVENYQSFLSILCDKVFLQCARVLRKGKYMAIIVSDFRDKGDFISFHSDLICLLNKRPVEGGGELALQGTKILIQNHKSLHPYGYPFAYVENIHHQYILIFKKK